MVLLILWTYKIHSRWYADGDQGCGGNPLRLCLQVGGAWLEVGLLECLQLFPTRWHGSEWKGYYGGGQLCKKSANVQCPSPRGITATGLVQKRGTTVKVVECPTTALTKEASTHTFVCTQIGRPNHQHIVKSNNDYTRPWKGVWQFAGCLSIIKEPIHNMFLLVRFNSFPFQRFGSSSPHSQLCHDPPCLFIEVQSDAPKYQC